jgi:hypothetical protein
VSGYEATMIIAIGTALIAMWTHVRFPSLAPTGFRLVLIHWIVAGAALYLIPLSLDAASGTAMTMVALVFVGFPALTYMFLSVIWIFSFLQGMRSGATR